MSVFSIPYFICRIIGDFHQKLGLESVTIKSLQRNPFSMKLLPCKIRKEEIKVLGFVDAIIIFKNLTNDFKMDTVIKEFEEETNSKINLGKSKFFG